jgi:hypothetical protein
MMGMKWRKSACQFLDCPRRQTAGRNRTLETWLHGSALQVDKKCQNGISHKAFVDNDLVRNPVDQCPGFIRVSVTSGSVAQKFVLAKSVLVVPRKVAAMCIHSAIFPLKWRTIPL